LHGIIRRTPFTLAELHDFVADGAPDDLLGQLRSQLLDWGTATGVMDALLALVIRLPRTRTPGGPAESHDLWAFLLSAPIKDIGVAIGAWELINGAPGVLLGAPDASKRGDSVVVVVLEPVLTLDRHAAARYSGAAAAARTGVVAIGCGALGSQVVLNAARSGMGPWVLIDHDLLRPHNLVRHALDASDVGHNKAERLAAAASRLASGDPPFVAIPADVLEPRVDGPRVDAAFTAAEVIADFSASVPVARHLACDVPGSARRLSLFLNPTGTDVVLLAEPENRSIRLDALEMQYYRALLREPTLDGHLRTSMGRIRHGRSCRDITVRIPQSLVGLHAAIGSEAVCTAVNHPEIPLIRVWRASPESMTVSATTIDATETCVITCGTWTIVTDRWLLDHLAGLRAAKLPSETGGVLLGAVDLDRRLLYVADTVPSPPDSAEWPTLYIRGCVGLRERVENAMAMTGGQLHYVGEWHSHPDGFDCAPSDDDRRVLSWLTEHLAADGLPGAMLIVGADHARSFHLADPASGVT
jgi:proteasome lid subunit RPN8/RPN11